MLKRNLVKTIFSNYGWLLIFPAVTAMKGEYNIIQEKKTFFQNTKDSAGLPPPDSSNFILSETDWLNAPKISLNRSTSKFVKDFLKKDEEELAQAKQRSGYYFKTIDEVFGRYNLPLELKYLAVVESNLKTNAVSKVGAKGMWQLMPATAREIGLKVNGKNDERLQFYKSTVVAAKYLKDLHAAFNDWLLVIAAYNSGPGTIFNAIKKSGSKNFWALQRYLPNESRSHVKRFIATHYYFEGKGSLVTMTRAESVQYIKAMSAFKASIESKQFKKDSGEFLAGVKK